ncbi:uncharacterized protein LOC106404226 [Brassica napus]|uniref:uncharacterized protein LOC106404226 n=1 Tax=Brassica napus TaxID=3708 RepID=UPI002079A9CB|nr:uncharacterized protein LOC106404226 [Brassica napus]
MADGGCSVSSIEGVHDSYIVVISGRCIMYDTGDRDFKLDSDRMGRAVYAKLITFVEDLKRAIIESYGLVGMSVAVEMSYWLGEHGSGTVGEREAPVQISNDKDFDLFTSARKVDKYINVFVTFKEEIDGKIHFLRPMGNLLKSKEVASSSEMQVGSTSADLFIPRSREEDARRRREKDKADDESLMKSVRAVELYGFEDVEASFYNEAVNDYTVDDIDFTLADADMYTGKLFSSKQKFKISLHIYALKQVFRFKFHKHAFNYVAAKCIDKNCKFYVMAKQLGESSTYQVRKAQLKHVCTSDAKAQYKKHATSKVIAALMRSKYERLQAGPRASELPEMLRTEFLFTATYWKCWKAKELATVAAQGTEESSYKLMPKYFYVVKYANPGSITDIKTEKDDKGQTRFKYAFMALKACIDGWKHLRKVFPIAFAVVDNETNESWSWFFEKLTEIVEDGSDLSIVSDRANQICVAKDQWYPLSHHGCCLVHLQRNVDAKFKKRNQKQMVGRAAEVFKVSHFKRLYAEIKLTDKSCWDYLEKIDPRHWTRSHFEGERYNLMSSNIAESLNKALVHARDSPIMALFEFIRRMISRWFVSRQRNISKMSGEIPRLLTS